ncbi:MAG: protogloblin ApPgb [Methanobacteriota archaeon]|nr:MAG: protogloblin ApPgb [Euryarchaeota archaeon]
MDIQGIPGYSYGKVPPAPISVDDLEKMKKSVLFDEKDVMALKQAGEILGKQVEEILDLWYGFVGSNPHLVYYFSEKNSGQPDSDYLAKVRKRFGQWIVDTCTRPYDQEWINYQYEIGLRHHRLKKNKVDGVNSVDHIPLRYLICFIYPITATIRQFLEKGAENPEHVDQMFHAWFKAVTLQVALWSYPYAKEDDW